MKLKEIAELTGCEFLGDGEKEIKKVAPLHEADEESISFLSNEKYKHIAIKSKAGALITYSKEGFEGRNLIITKNPYAVWAKVLKIFHKEKEYEEGIDSTAKIGEGTIVGKGSFIGPYVVLGKNCIIGERVVIEALTVIGDNCLIGDESHLYPRVVLYDGVELGKRVILHSGVVVGSDGFGYAEDDGKIIKVPQIGKVVIEDDVEIGANTTIDRASIEKTLIQSGTKIDNLCQIAHNVVIGRNCVIIAQSGISGSTKLGDGVIMSGQSGAVGHIKIGNYAVIGAKSAVTKDVPDKAHYTGIPAKDHKKWLKEKALIGRLEELFEKIQKGEKK